MAADTGGWQPSSREEYIATLREANAGLLGRQNNGDNGPGKSTGTFNDAISGFTNAATKFGTGTYAAQDAVAQATSALGHVPGVSVAVASAFKQVADTGLTVNKQLNDAGSVGAGFGNRLGEAAESILGARMTFQDYSDTMKRGTSMITGFGGNVNQSAKTLLALDQQLQETNIARTLVESGVSQKEINESNLVFLNKTRNLNLLSTQQNERLIESSAKFAEQLDISARLYGKSREEQLKDVKAQQDKAEVQAALQSQGIDAQLAFAHTQQKIGTMGKAYMDMASEITAYGTVMSEEGNALKSALGDSGQELEDAIKQSNAAKTEQQKKDADERLEAAKRGVAVRQTESDYLAIVQFNRDKYGQTIKAAYVGDLERQAGQAAISQAAEEGAKKNWNQEQIKARYNEILNENLKKATQEQKGQTPDGNTDPKAAMGRVMNDVEGTLKDFSAGFGKTLNSAANTAGKGITESGSILSKAITNALAPRTASEANRTFTPNNLIPGAAPSEARGSYNPATRSNAVPHATGTLGNFGEFFHNYGKEGFPATLHGEEMVLPKAQLPQFMQQFTSQMKDKIPDPRDLMDKLSAQQPSTEMLDQIMYGGARSQEAMTQKGTLGGNNTTLNDLADLLSQLNKHMGQMVSHTETLTDNSSRQIRATTALSGNMLA